MLPTESDLTAVRSILGQAQSAANSYAPVPVRFPVACPLAVGRVRAASLIRPRVRISARARPQLRRRGGRFIAAELIHGWLSGHRLPKALAIDPELRWTLVTDLARLGWLDDTAISAELERDPTIAGAQQAAGARAAQPAAAAKVDAWQLAVEDDTIPNGTQSAICLGFWQRGQDELLAPYIARYFEAAEAISSASGIWATRGISMRNNVLRFLFPWPVEKQPSFSSLTPGSNAPS